MNDQLNMDEDSFIGTLMTLATKKQYRSAWTYLINNIDSNHIRIHDAGILLEHLSNEYGDIGDIKDECFLKKKLDIQSNLIVKLLR